MTAVASVDATSSRSKLTSLLLPLTWCTSAARTLLPSCSAAAACVALTNALSSAPPTVAVASVPGPIAPAGRLSRRSSTPFR
ncbi:MAG: hypothetical protein U0802_12375 [Candidatus Binatia bacterium]